MRNATRRALTSAAVLWLLLGGGCKKEEDAPPTPPPVPRPAAAVASAPAPTTAPDVAVLLAAGGTNWLSHEGGKFDGRTFKTGKDYWIWPADDVAYTPQDTPAGRALVVRLNYRLRPGGERVTGGKVYATLESTSPGPRVSLRSPALDFDPAAEGGALSIPFAPWKGTSAGEVIVHLNRPGDPAPLTNVLRLKASAP